MMMRVLLSLLLLLLAITTLAQAQKLSTALSLPSTIQHVYQVEIGDYRNTTVAAGDKLAVRACAGLFNRDDQLAQGGSAVYILERREDPGWYADTTVELNVTDWVYNISGSTAASYWDDPRLVNTTQIGVDDFIEVCLQNRAAIKGYIRYSLDQQQAILPNLMTLAGVLDAVPIDLGSLKGNLVAPALSNTDLLDRVPLVLDALQEFDGQTPLQVATLVFDTYGSQTTGVAKINPGYAQEENEATPTLVKGEVRDLGTSDFIVKNRIFAFYLWYSCVPETDDNALWNRMTNPSSTPWTIPIPVYGYDATFNVLGGLVWEASTHCGTNFNTGAIPTANTVNLSFFNRRKPQGARLPGKIPVQQQQELHPEYESQTLTYDSSKTYLAFVMGDGDNVRAVKRDRREWMETRTRHCGVRQHQVFGLAGNGPQREVNRQPECAPLLWTMSPHLDTLAPDMWEWFRTEAKLATNGKDAFVLPPSGHLYAYPGLMNNANKNEFVRLTEQDARRMDTNAMVAWEIAGTWGDAMDNYFPKYLENGVIEAVFAVNV